MLYCVSLLCLFCRYSSGNCVLNIDFGIKLGIGTQKVLYLCAE